MTPDPAAGGPVCPVCGAALSAAAESCWMCGHRLTPDLPDEPPDGPPQLPPPVPPQEAPAAAPPAVDEPARFTFSLGTLMLLMTLISISVGLSVAYPALGIPFAALAAPAFLRVSLHSSKKRLAGQPLGIEHKLELFFTSFAVMLAVVGAAGVAFFVTCWVGVGGGLVLGGNRGYDGLTYGFFAGLIFGVLAGGALGVYLLVKLWPLREKKPAVRQP